jgi:hypothetical protein
MISAHNVNIAQASEKRLTIKIATRRTSIAMAMQSAISLVPDDYNPTQVPTI